MCSSLHEIEANVNLMVQMNTTINLTLSITTFLNNDGNLYLKELYGGHSNTP